MSIVDDYRKLEGLRADLAAHESAAKARAAELRGQIDALSTAIRREELGLDNDKIALALTVLAIRGTYATAGDERSVARHNAISDLISGCKVLAREYFGTKSYDRWHGQLIQCAYGMSPSHGSVIFAIGLRDAARSRALTESEVEAAVYYLTHIERIEQAASAKAAA